MSKLSIRNIDSHSIAIIDNRSYFLEFVMTKNKALRISKNKNHFFNYNFDKKKNDEKYIKNDTNMKLIKDLKFSKPIDKESKDYKDFKFANYQPRKSIYVSNKYINSDYKSDFKKIFMRNSRYCKLHKINEQDIKIEVDIPFEIGYKKDDNKYEFLVPHALSKDLLNSNLRELVLWGLEKYGDKNKDIEYKITYI